jgi:uncharacterized damage-inducible protein DinB
MKNGLALHKEFMKELDAEAKASRKCLERIPEKLFDWKPHERSMPMKSLTQVVADIPNWITQIVQKSEIDFAKYDYAQPKTSSELVKHFDKSLKDAKKALGQATDQSLSKTFALKNNGKVLMKGTKKEHIVSSINHLVHHRGQLTVYMRLNNIPVPSIYGPSADENRWN